MSFSSHQLDLLLVNKNGMEKAPKSLTLRVGGINMSMYKRGLFDFLIDLKSVTYAFMIYS